jgi:HEAT repeat protein
MFGVSVKKVERWSEKKKADKIIKALSHSSKEIRAAAAKGLGNIDSEEANNALIISLKDPEPKVRLNAVISLGKIGRANAIEHLRNVAKNDGDTRVKEEAAHVLEQLREKLRVF